MESVETLVFQVLEENQGQGDPKDLLDLQETQDATVIMENEDELVALEPPEILEHKDLMADLDDPVFLDTKD